MIKNGVWVYIKGNYVGEYRYFREFLSIDGAFEWCYKNKEKYNITKVFDEHNKKEYFLDTIKESWKEMGSEKQILTLKF